jgi:hypothetical protein
MNLFFSLKDTTSEATHLTRHAGWVPAGAVSGRSASLAQGKRGASPDGGNEGEDRDDACDSGAADEEEDPDEDDGELRLAEAAG